MDKPRVLLKISGETLSGIGKYRYSRQALNTIAAEILSVANQVELAIVIGGGNIIRGAELKDEIGLEDSIVADYAGMVATIINALIFQEILEEIGLEVRVMSALEIKAVAELYIRRRAIRHLSKGRIVILAGGTGNPDVSTDSAMVLRGHELGVNMVLKGSKTDGVFDKDPMKFGNARFIRQISHQDFLDQQLKIVDWTAVASAKKHSMPIIVFNIFEAGNLKKVLDGKNVGSQIV